MSYTIANRGLCIVLLVVAACKIKSDNDTSTRSVKASEVLNNKSRYFTKEDECLIEITDTLQRDTESQTLAEEMCLPRSKISFLLSIPSTDTRDISVAPHLKLAILFDASVSLVEQDSSRARFDALKEYLLAIFDKKKNKQISSAEIKVYPFRYCNKGEHSLELRASTTKDQFTKAVDTLIGTRDVGNRSINIVDKTDLGNLRAYGAVGSTNYLNSFAEAKKFFDQETEVALKPNKSTVELKQMLIFSDGLPFTFNDSSRNTIDTTNADCNLSQIGNWTLEGWQDNLFAYQNRSTYHIDERLTDCVIENFFYPQDSCQRPKSSDKGISSPDIKAWDDPLNHALGMIQHSHVIEEEKKDFAIYSVHLNNCKTKSDSTEFDENFLCQKISENFFRSFSDGFVAVDNAADLKDRLTKQTLKSQFDLDYKKGVATLADGTRVDEKLTFYKDTANKPSIIKVDGMTVTRMNSKGKTTVQETTFDYQDHDNDILTASLQGEARRLKHHYKLAYNFRFDDDCRDEDIEHKKKLSNRNDDVVALEVHSWQKNDYRAWCVLPVIDSGLDIDGPPDPPAPPPPPPVFTCANYQGNRSCAGKGGLVWIATNTGTPPGDCCGPQLSESPENPGQQPDDTVPPAGEGDLVLCNGKYISKGTTCDVVCKGTNCGGGKTPAVTCATVVERNRSCQGKMVWIDSKTGTTPEACCGQVGGADQDPVSSPPIEEIVIMVEEEELEW